MYRRGRWVHGPALSLGWLATGESVARIGVRTRRGIKGAVRRNRLKRQLRAVIQASTQRLKQSGDMVLVAHPRGASVKTAALATELQQLCARARLV